MAQLVRTLTVEMDLVGDAIDDVERIFRALARKHGPAFRALEREVERLMNGDAELSPPPFHHIGGGCYVAEPYPELAAIVREARALGVI